MCNLCYSSKQKEITGLTSEKDSLTTAVSRLTEVVQEGKQREDALEERVRQLETEAEEKRKEIE